MIETYDVSKLIAINDESIVPGIFVTLVKQNYTGLFSDEKFGGCGVVISTIDGQITVLWSSAPKTNPFPIVRKTSQKLIAQQIISVQPMPVPSASFFYLDYMYGSGSISI